jgi:hypothetical protein
VRRGTALRAGVVDGVKTPNDGFKLLQILATMMCHDTVVK